MTPKLANQSPPLDSVPLHPIVGRCVVGDSLAIDTEAKTVVLKLVYCENNDWKIVPGDTLRAPPMHSGTVLSVTPSGENVEVRLDTLDGFVLGDRVIITSPNAEVSDDAKRRSLH